MKPHRIIWYIAGLAALAAATVLMARNQAARARYAQEHFPQPGVPMGWVLSGDQADMLIQTMLRCLETDPQARRIKTREIVRAVAALAESGARETAGTYYALGLRRAAEEGKSEGAEGAYRKAIALRPEWSWPYNSLGILLHAMERTDEAEQMFRAAIERDPAWSRPHNDLAILLRLTGRLEEARQEAILSLNLDPEDVATHNNYGNLLVALGRFEDAQQAYRDAIDLEPDHPAPYYNLACLASLRGDADEALSYLNCAVVFDQAFRTEARTNKDFANLHDNADFQALVHGGGEEPVVRPQR